MSAPHANPDYTNRSKTPNHHEVRNITVTTDEEREALSNFLFSVYEHGSQPNALREADAILSFLASIRPAQGEPTDAQVHSAAVAIDPAAWEPGIFYWEASGARDNSLELARAALKAAFTAGQEEQS